jgi:hypothetical protein
MAMQNTAYRLMVIVLRSMHHPSFFMHPPGSPPLRQKEITDAMAKMPQLIAEYRVSVYAHTTVHIPSLYVCSV